ncbi:cationic trypsin-like [Anabas testudineus]|uniref:Peptidase S1 domain-containing protein n=1 Tax=Anabas testudineus TaxID=64144 RepID=A0A7N6AK26_ANATE|nr:cationic trypsin-like [Anabas testudineus]
MARLALLSLLSLLWVGVTMSTAVDLQKRIIGGQTCGQNERQYHVKLSTDPTGSSLLCGGSLISKQWILTAAHCWKSNMYAVLGVHPGPGQVVKIIEPAVIFKEKNTNERTHDLMLLKLPSPTKVRPVRLPECKRQPTIGQKVQMAGFGATAVGRNNRRISGTSNTLQCADFELVDCQRLQNVLRNNNPQFYNKRQHQSWLCYQAPGVDTCPGDSGGGVVFQNRIYGVHSFTGDANFACSESAAFMNICHEPYYQWIKTTIASPKKCWWCG